MAEEVKPVELTEEELENLEPVILDTQDEIQDEVEEEK